jgi:hypothetical protein
MRMRMSVCTTATANSTESFLNNEECDDASK